MYMNHDCIKFIYKNKIYPLDYNLFKKHANYEFEESVDYHYLINEFEGDLNLTEETIQSFLDFFQSQTVNLTINNILSINYLSSKYRISKLIKLCEQFIQKNTNDILNNILSNKTEIGEEIEDLISSNFSNFIHDDCLLTFSISQLFRIIKKYIQKSIKLQSKDKENNNNEELEIKIIDFLFKVIQFNGKEANILFSLFEFSKKGRKYLNQKLLSNLNSFDFNFAISNMIMRFIDNDEEHQEQEKKFQEKYESLEKQFQQKIQEQETKFQEKYESLIKNFQQEIINRDLIIEKMNDKIEENRIKENNRIEQLNKTIYNVNSSKYFNDNNDYETFNKLNCESQLMIILGLSDTNPNNKTIQNISSLLQYLSKEQQKSNYKFNQIKYIQIETQDNKMKLFTNIDNQKIIIPSSTFEMLQSNQTIKSKELINVINNFDEIYTKINHPKNHEILDDIINIKKSTELNLNVDIILSKIDKNDKTFQYNKFIKSVEIEPTVNKISCANNKGFFEGCSSLVKISIPSTVTKICERSFKLCSNLKEITIPSSVKSIKEGSFEDCTSLVKINIQSPITIINNNMFKGCSSLREITIPSSVTSIESFAFSECSSLTQIIFEVPSSVKIIGDSAFRECSSLTQISIPSSVTEIGDFAFRECSSLTQIKIPSSVTSIKSYAFSKCSSLTEISIPSSVKTIESSVFIECSSLTQISIPSSVETIESSAFRECSSLTQISVPSSVKIIGDSAFRECSSLTQISIPSSVTSIKSYAFFKCSSLTEISIPSSVKTIESSAFRECSSLTQITFEIPSSIKKIGDSAFYGCSSLTQIPIPTSVTEIGDNIFEGIINHIPDELPSKNLKSIKQKEDTLELLFWNKKIQRRAIYCYIRRGVTILDLKEGILRFFKKEVKPTITDFRLVTKEGSKTDMNDTIKNNYFDEKYNNDEAYDLMLDLKQNYYKREGSKDTLIYFREVKLTVKTYICLPKENFNHEFPLAIENNSYFKWESSVKEVIETEVSNLNELPFHPFQKTPNLDEISKEDDMKKYSECGLILYLFPIKATFEFKSQKTNIMLKKNLPLRDYIPTITNKLKINSKSENLLFKIKKDDTFVKVDLDIPIHEILKEQKTEPVIFDILNISPQSINIKIPYKDRKFIDIYFKYKLRDTINDLVKQIKDYFGIHDEFVLQNDSSEEVENKKLIKGFTSLFLKYQNPIDLKLTRSFKINNNIIEKTISLDKKVISVIKEIAEDITSDKSPITLKIDETPMNPHILFASYYIPPEKEILVCIDDFQEFVTLKINEKSPIRIKTGFTPKMKIKSLKNLKELKEKVAKDLQAELFFFKNDKLDETKTFEEYQIINNDTITVYASKHYLYKFNGKTYPILADESYDQLMNSLKQEFKLNDKFFIDQNGKILTEKAYSRSNLPNGTKFEIKFSIKMNFEINNEYKINANSDKQVKDIIKQLSKEINTPQDKIQLFNDVGVMLLSDSYIYSSFAIKEKNHIYKIQFKNAQNFTFQNSNGKFFNESFLPSMKIGDVLEELKNIGKKIEENSFIIFMGKVIDNNETLSNLIPNKKDEDEDEDEDDQLFLIENEIPEEITVKLNFQFDKENEDDIDIKLIKPTEVLNVRYWASNISGQELDMLSLVANDETLNDGDLLEEDTEIIVSLSSSSDSKYNEEQIQDAITKTQKNINKKESERLENSNSTSINHTQKIRQIAPKVVKSSDDDSDLEEEDEEEEEDPFARGNGTYGPAPSGPEDEYIFKFKIVNGEEFQLQLPKNISVEEIKEEIAERQDIEVENITIFIGNQRLADFNVLTNLIIPKQVKYFSVKIIDLAKTLICSKTRLRK